VQQPTTGITPSGLPAHYPALLDTRAAAALLGVSPATLTTWRSVGRYALPFVRVGRSIRYRVADLERFIEERTATQTS